MITISLPVLISIVIFIGFILFGMITTIRERDSFPIAICAIIGVFAASLSLPISGSIVKSVETRQLLDKEEEALPVPWKQFLKVIRADHEKHVKQAAFEHFVQKKNPPMLTADQYKVIRRACNANFLSGIEEGLSPFLDVSALFEENKE